MQRQLSYHYKYAPNLYAIDAEPTTAPLEINGSEMSASCRLASTKRDREGDIYEVQGLLTDNHRANPIALVDHGLYHPWPIGKCESPKGRYAVEIVGDEVLQTTWFSQKSLVAAQIYQMILDGDMRGNSIGYRPIEQRPLEPDPEGGHFRKRDGRPAGWHILRSELIEACVHGDTRIPTLDGLLAIRDLVGTSPTVLSEYGPRQCEQVISKGLMPCRMIKTQTGSEITAADNHKFRVLDADGVLTWRRAAEVSPGDAILAQLGDRGVLPEDRGESEDFWFAVGLFYGDGSYNHKGSSFRWAVNDNELDSLDRLKRFLKADGYVERDASKTDNTRYLDSAGNKHYRIEEQRPVKDAIRNGSQTLYILHTDHAGLRRVIPSYQAGGNWRDAGAPAAVWRVGRKQMAAFLNGLFCADGYAGGTSCHLGFTTVREQLARDVQQLLRILGILSRVRQQKQRSQFNAREWVYPVEVVGNRSKTAFAERIGFTVRSKQENCERLATIPKRPHERVLGIPCTARATCKMLPGKTGGPDAVSATIRRLKSVGGLMTDRLIPQILARANIHGTKRETLALLQEYNANGWYFEKVTSNSPAGEHEVFDPVNVEGTHSYVSNGMVSHNTWTCRPMNPDCVRRIVSRGKLAGKTLAPSIKAMLSEVDPGQRAFLFFDRGKSCGHDCECGPCKDHHGKVDGAMSAVDSGSGGALVSPPSGPGRSFKRNPPTSYGRRLKPMGYGKGRYDEYGRLLGKAGVGAGADENTRSSRREAGQGNRNNAGGGDVDDADDIEENGHPYGAQVLKAKCMDMADHVKTYMKAMTPLEHEGTKKCLMKCMRSDVDNMKMMEKHWNKTYKADHGAMGVDMPKFDEEDDDQVDMDEGKDMDAVPKKDVVVKGKAVESTNVSDQEDHGDIDPKYLEALQKLDETFDRINARVS